MGLLEPDTQPGEFSAPEKPASIEDITQFMELTEQAECEIPSAGSTAFALFVKLRTSYDELNVNEY